MALNDLPLIAPDRKLRGIRPFKAVHHFRKLIADKEDTKQVFYIIEALAGRKVLDQAKVFIPSPEGQDFIQRESKTPLADMLDDHARWADCAPNSVAQHYMRFMKHEGLTAAGLADESYDWKPRDERPNDQLEWYLCRLRDTHDLFHVLTTYGRDALGEAALLGFSYEQNQNLGVKFIAYAAARQIKMVTGTSAPLYGAIREGRDLGKAAHKLAHMDVEAVMRSDIDEVRKQLNIGEPVLYRKCLEQLDAEGFAEENLGINADQTAQAA
ncbi:MAG: Coq4 family protein [Marinomonas sp.]